MAGIHDQFQQRPMQLICHDLMIGRRQVYVKQQLMALRPKRHERIDDRYILSLCNISQPNLRFI